MKISSARRLVAVALVVAAALVVTGCSPSGPPDSDPSIRGTVSTVTGSTMLIEGVVESDTSFDKASVTITEDTQIFNADNRPVSAVDLSPGLRVEAWFTGPVAESYPVQATASDIRILSE